MSDLTAFFLSLSAFFADTAPPPPDFQLQNLKKEPAKLSDHRGKITVLNFWATWYVPCRKEMPLFVELQNEYGPSGVNIRFPQNFSSLIIYGGVKVHPTASWVYRNFAFTFLLAAGQDPGAAASAAF